VQNVGYEAVLNRAKRTHLSSSATSSLYSNHSGTSSSNAVYASNVTNVQPYKAANIAPSSVNASSGAMMNSSILQNSSHPLAQKHVNTAANSIKQLAPKYVKSTSTLATASASQTPLMPASSVDKVETKSGEYYAIGSNIMIRV